MLRVRGLTRIFPASPEPVHALRGVDLDVVDGGMTAVLGPSGCGKTTLLRIMAGFDRPDGGTVHLGDRLIAGPGVFVRPERRDIGVVSQEGALFPHLSVAQNIAYGLDSGRLAGLHPRIRRARRERVEELLELVGLPGVGTRRPDELSGGQQQRVALARALAPAPAVLLLDEPFSALDAALRVELREEVRDLLRGIGTTAVLVTHDQAEALSLADHVAVMRAGRVVQAGAPAEVYARPVDPQTAAFLGESVELDCRVCGAVGGPELDLDCPLGRIRVDAHTVFPAGPTSDGPKTGESARLVLRPEQLELADGGVGGEVTAVGFFGHDALVRVTLTDGTPVAVRADGRRLPQVGDRIGVRVAQAPRQAPVAVV